MINQSINDELAINVLCIVHNVQKHFFFSFFYILHCKPRATYFSSGAVNYGGADEAVWSFDRQSEDERGDRCTRMEGD